LFEWPGTCRFVATVLNLAFDAPSTRLELADMVRVQRAHDSRVDQSFRNGRNHEEIDFCLCSGSCKLWRIGSIEPGQPATQASTNGNADTATQTRKTPNSMREGTTSGVSTGSQTGSANGLPNSRPMTTTGPAGQASKTESTPK
jgi:hypothetical protein